jgi:Domain of unknown function (DUF4175)
MGERRSGLRSWVPTPNGARQFRLGGVGGAASLPPCPPWLKCSRNGAAPEARRSEAHAQPGELTLKRYARRVRSPLLEPLLQLAEKWRLATRAASWQVAFAVVACGGVVALLDARSGTARARAVAASVLAATATVSLTRVLLERRRLKDPRRILRGPVHREDRVRADRAIRALSFVGADGEVEVEGTSRELARLHVTRVLAELPSEPTVKRAARATVRVGWVALALGIGALGWAIANGWSVFEGGDVLLARRGIAPVSARWLDDVAVGVRPPEYLHLSPISDAGNGPLLLPYGSVITVRGTPLHPGRGLILNDGSGEVAFVDDGAGAVVARWSLTQSQTLRVVARFGEVVIPEADAIQITSIPDDPPVVSLEGAPRQIAVAEATDDIPLRYEASDDHGLREVHLVLRCGTREERRVLARLDGETKTDKGGQVLKLRDPFVVKSHAPVRVNVEARDNDPLTGPKWGASSAITIVPPDVGEPEANLLDALRRVRDALVDTLATRLKTEVPSDTATRTALAEGDNRIHGGNEDLLHQVLSATYAGVRVPSRIRAILLAQEEQTKKEIVAEVRAPSASSHDTVVRATERFVLVADATVQGLAVRDAREAARQLADSAEDVAIGATEVQNEALDARSRGAVRMDAAIAVLGAGSRVMRRLGDLGRDLGEIIEADLSRIKRAREAGDLVHAELAARDLAIRLHQPDRSFGARGGVRRAGGEAGGAQGTSEDGREAPDEVEQAFDEAAQDLERLAQQHAGEMGKVEEALAASTSEQELKQLGEEAKRHAEAVREAARPLPRVGQGSDSWTSKGAAARDLAEQMARSLEDFRPDNAVESGRSAMGALDEAKKMLQRGGWLNDPSGVGQRAVDQARRKLEAEAQWAEEQLREIRRRAAERARSQLEQGGDEENKLADRARELAQKARTSGTFPQQAIESIEDAERAAREAATALRRDDAEQGVARQREAQRDLEAAREQLRGDDEESAHAAREDGDGRTSGGATDIVPKAGTHHGPEEFRRRVMRGLGQPASGTLKDAVKRYAEGLLR